MLICFLSDLDDAHEERNDARAEQNEELYRNDIDDLNDNLVEPDDLNSEEYEMKYNRCE